MSVGFKIYIYIIIYIFILCSSDLCQSEQTSPPAGSHWTRKPQRLFSLFPARGMKNLLEHSEHISLKCTRRPHI